MQAHPFADIISGDILPTPTPTPTTPSTITPTISPSTPSPDLGSFNCSGKPNGLYPHPRSCEDYAVCYDGNPTLYTCPSGTLYYPALTSCVDPSFYVCPLTCDGRLDGLYVNPYGCDYFLQCQTQFVQIFQCAFPFLFDRTQLVCNFPHLVQCD